MKRKTINLHITFACDATMNKGHWIRYLPQSSNLQRQKAEWWLPGEWENGSCSIDKSFSFVDEKSSGD